MIFYREVQLVDATIHLSASGPLHFKKELWNYSNNHMEVIYFIGLEHQSSCLFIKYIFGIWEGDLANSFWDHVIQTSFWVMNFLAYLLFLAFQLPLLYPAFAGVPGLPAVALLLLLLSTLMFSMFWLLLDPLLEFLMLCVSLTLLPPPAVSCILLFLAYLMFLAFICC